MHCFMSLSTPVLVSTQRRDLAIVSPLIHGLLEHWLQLDHDVHEDVDLDDRDDGGDEEDVDSERVGAGAEPQLIWKKRTAPEVL